MKLLGLNRERAILGRTLLAMEVPGGLLELLYGVPQCYAELLSQRDIRAGRSNCVFV